MNFLNPCLDYCLGSVKGEGHLCGSKNVEDWTTLKKGQRFGVVLSHFKLVNGKGFNTVLMEEFNVCPTCLELYPVWLLTQ